MTAISDLTGVGPALAKLLKEGGFKTAEDVAAASFADLTNVPGIGAARAAGLLKAAESLSKASARPTKRGTTQTPTEDWPLSLRGQPDQDAAAEEAGSEEALSAALQVAEAAREAAELKAAKAKAKAKKAARKSEELMAEVARAKEKAKAKAKKVKAKARKAIEKEKAKARAILGGAEAPPSGKLRKSDKNKSEKKKSKKKKSKL